MARVHLNAHALAAVLAGLRCWQANPMRGSCGLDSIATNGGKLKALNADEIDELIARINSDAEYADADLIARARELYCEDSDDDIEVDDFDVQTSRADSAATGTWVQAWVWVPDEEKEGEADGA